MAQISYAFVSVYIRKTHAKKNHQKLIYVAPAWPKKGQIYLPERKGLFHEKEAQFSQMSKI